MCWCQTLGLEPTTTSSPLCQWPLPLHHVSTADPCPGTPFLHFIPHMFSILFLSICALWSDHHFLPSLPSLPSSIEPISAALLARWQAHHTLSIRLVRPGRALHCSTPSHSPSLVPSVPVTLSVTLKSFRLPDIVCFPPPSRRRSGDGRVRAGVKINLALDVIAFDIFSSCHCTQNAPFLFSTKTNTWVQRSEHTISLCVLSGHSMSVISSSGRQCLTCRRPHPVVDVPGKRTANEKDKWTL